MFVLAIPPYMLQSLVAVPLGTCDSFKIFNNASWYALDDNNKEYWTGCFLNYSTTEYSLLFGVLMNFVVSSSLLFFLCGSSARTSFPFPFTFASFNSLDCYTQPVLVISPFPRLAQSHFPYDQHQFYGRLRCKKYSETIIFCVRDSGFARVGPPITNGFERE